MKKIKPLINIIIDWIIRLIPLIVSLIALETALINRQNNLKAELPENIFICSNVVSEVLLDIDLVKYEITSLSNIAGYKIIPYPYIRISTDDKISIYPIINDFMQVQYVADSNGKCVLTRENTEDLIEKLKKDGYDVSFKCFVVIQYISLDGNEHREVFELRNGQLQYADEKEAVIVMEKTHDEESSKINMNDSNKNLYLMEGS